jgi:holo-[acyl-carrier protein] synthase
MGGIMITDVASGVDIERISRFKKLSVEFKKKIFTANEIKYCSKKNTPEKHFAVRYCAKEAIIKSFSQYQEQVFFKSIEIYNDARGMPHAKLLKRTGNTYFIRISLAHSSDYAIAFAVIGLVGRRKNERKTGRKNG